LRPLAATASRCFRQLAVTLSSPPPVKLLSDALVSNDDFFVEQVHLTAIVFDNTDDVTVWATTFRNEEAHFFHLGLPFHDLDTLLRVADDRAAALAEEVADALATAEEWPCLLEYTTDEAPPIPLPGVALKLAVTFPADEEQDEDDPQPHNIFYLEGIFARLSS
jgi:hypothetical protein